MTVGDYAWPAEVVVDARTVVVHGAPPSGLDRSTIERSGAGDVLVISSGANVRMEHLVVTGATGGGSTGVTCLDDSALDLEDVQIDSNTGLGLLVGACMFVIRDSYIGGNGGGGLSLRRGRAVVVNDVIAGNGTSGPAGMDVGAMFVGSMIGTDSVIEPNTIIANHAADSQADGLDCRVAGLTVRNTILTGDATKLRVSGTCTYDHVLYGPDDPMGRLGTADGNMLIPSTTDLQFVNAAGRDYHIKSNSFAKGKGTSTGLAQEAMTDVDGDVRPQGAADVGIDEIPD